MQAENLKLKDKYAIILAKMKKKIILCVVIYGITQIVAQTVLLRELLTVFLGNELIIGIILTRK